MGAYYNEIDPFAAEWLRKLIRAGLIPDGEVDERSICDVSADDLRGFGQCHFFAGIGGWPYALKLAGYEGLECWTGSCPCQPISSAGLQKGHADERHVWPAFYSLISKRKPSIVFGEQVAGTLGFEWFSGVRADLEGIGYACGGADLCAAGVGAPHIRQRIFWCALADADLQHGAECDGRPQGRLSASQRNNAARSGFHGEEGVWASTRWFDGADGKRRRIKPEIHLLADGVPNRLGRLRGFGNAIVPQVGAAFIKAVMEL